MGLTIGNAGGINNVQTVKRWSSQAIRELSSALKWNKYIGGKSSLISKKDDLQRGSGDRIFVPFIWKNASPAIVGNVSVMDKLQNIRPTGDALVIQQAQYPYVAPNKDTIVQQRLSFDYLDQSRLNMRQQIEDNFEIGLLAQGAGYNSPYFYIDGREPMLVRPGTDYQGLNAITPPSAGRWFCINQTKESALTAKDTMSSRIGNGLLAKAQNANPVFGRIEGLDKGVGYIWIMHPTQEQQFRNDIGAAAWSEVTKFAYMGEGDSGRNPLYGQIIGIWRDTLLVRSRYVPYGVNDDGTPNLNVRRSIFCGANAFIYATGAADSGREMPEVNIFLDATYDGGNKTALIAKRIYGLKKAKFSLEGDTGLATPDDAPDHAVMVISTWAPDDYADDSGLTPVQLDADAIQEKALKSGRKKSRGQAQDEAGARAEAVSEEFKAKNAPGNPDALTGEEAGAENTGQEN